MTDQTGSARPEKPSTLNDPQIRAYAYQVLLIAVILFLFVGAGPDPLPPQKLRAAALGIVAANFGAREDEIAQGTARALGFKVVGAQLREVIHLAIEAMVEAGEVSREGDLLILPKVAVGGESTVEAGPTVH